MTFSTFVYGKIGLKESKKTDKETLRVLAIKMYKKGISQKEISLYSGVRTHTISIGKLLSAEEEQEIQHMMRLQKNPEKVALFFYPKSIKYVVA